VTVELLEVPYLVYLVYLVNRCLMPRIWALDTPTVLPEMMLTAGAGDGD
jgi:hypothetical protein